MQVGHQLSPMDRQFGFDSLDLDNHFRIDQQVDAICSFHYNAHEMDRHRNLLLHAVTANGQRMRQAAFVSGFQQAGTKCQMDLKSAFDYRRCDPFQLRTGYALIC